MEELMKMAVVPVAFFGQLKPMKGLGQPQSSLKTRAIYRIDGNCERGCLSMTWSVYWHP